VEQRQPLKSLRDRQSKKIQYRRSRVDKTRTVANSFLGLNQTRCGNDVRNPDVLVVKEKGMSVVPVVLAEGLSMIAKNKQHGLALQLARPQSFQKFAKRGIAVVQRISIV